MKKLREVLTKNFHLKFLAFIFSILFWFLATNRELTEATIKLRVELEPSGNYRVIDFKPKEVYFTVEGYRKELTSLKEKGEVLFKLPENLEVEKGWVKVKLTKGRFLIPKTIKILKIEPSLIEVKVEKLIKVAFPITPKLKNLPRGAFIELHPNYAVVSLPEELQGVPIKVETEEVDLKGVNLPAELIVPINVRFKVTPEKVKVLIKEERNER